MTRRSGDEAVQLAARCGLELDEWQQHVLRAGLGERGDGSWSAFEVGLVVARQNGKGAVLLARELAGVLLFGERLVIHSAHEAETARNHMLEWLQLIEGSPLLRSKVRRTPMGRGSEAIEFSNGARVRFRTRTRGGGRGLSGDLVVVDEAFELPRAAVDALLPTLSSRPNPQMWYASSAVDQMSHPNGLMLSSLRHRALSDDPGRLTFCEWSPADDADVSDPQVWAEANPALGIRISADYVAAEHRSLSRRGFAVERLSIGDWPDPNGEGSGGDAQPVPAEVWDGLEDGSAVPGDPVVFALDVSPDRSWASIGAAGWTADGRLAVELVERRNGASWVAQRLAALVERHGPAAVVVDGFAAVDGLEGLPGVVVAGAADVAAGFAGFVDGCTDGSLTHLGQPELSESLASADTRAVAGGRGWKRSRDGGDVTALVAVTMASWGLRSLGDRVAPEPFVFVS